MNKLTKSTMILSMLLLATACGSSGGSSSSNDGANGGNNGATRTGNQALEGRVMGEEGEDVEGRDVVVSEVQSDGSVEVLSEGEVQTDAEGRYEVEVEHSGGDLIVEVLDGERVSSALVGSWQLTVDAATTVAPIGAETTVETLVFLEAYSNGSWNEHCTAEALRDFISADIAAEMLAGSNTEADVEAYASAAVGAMTAEGETYTGELVGMTEAEMELLFEARAEAQAEFDASMDAAADAEEQAQAAQAHAEASAEAAIEAGVSAEEAGLAAEAAAWTTFTFLTELDGQARAQALSDANMTLAAHTTTEVEAHFMAFGGDIEAIVAAGAELEAELEAAASEANSAGDEIDEAWASYEAAISAELEARLSDSLGLTSVLVATEIQAGITAASQALTTALLALDASGDAALAAEAAVSAFATFQGEFTGDAFVSSLTAAGMSLEEAEATVELYALLAVR